MVPESRPGPRFHDMTLINRVAAHRRHCFNATIALVLTIGLDVANSAKAPSITGHVVDGAGYPVPGVSVSTTPEAGGGTKYAMTRADGTYHLESLPDGVYRVDFELLGFDLARRNHVRVRQDATASADATLLVSAICECVAVIDPTLRERSGQVVDESNRPLPHTRLEITSPLFGSFGYADGEGRFRVRVPVSGSWTLTVSDGGFGTVKQHVSGAPDVPIVIRLPYIGTRDLPDAQLLKRGCRCPGDLFTHDGR
jgi:hypothetical protein